MTRSADDVRHLARELGVRFVRLQFTDILGVVKNVDLPLQQLDKALAGDVIIDGSAIEGFVRRREADMHLLPDPETFALLPWKGGSEMTARLICDLRRLDGEPFEGDPRSALKRVAAAAAKLGYRLNAGPEPEFFLFLRDAQGRGTTDTHDQASYYDLAPVDLGEAVRGDVVRNLQEMGFEIEQAHHEIAPGQHEIDWKYSEAVAAADAIVTFRFAVRTLAAERGLHATFMPKPLNGVNGSGLHVHQSIFRGGENAFFDPQGPDQLAPLARQYLAGLLAHARGFTAVTNPLVNSYKRLVPGYDAPIYVAWSRHDPGVMVRLPARRGIGTRLEVKSPDPACNPYLALAVMLQSGLDGIARRLEAPPEAPASPESMSPEERAELGIVALPANLGDALEELRADEVVQEALGEHIFECFNEAKAIEWEVYRSQVHRWEVDQYLATF